MSGSDRGFYRAMTELIQAGQIEKAVVKLKAFLDKDADDEVALSLYGAALMRKGDTDQALVTFRHAAKVYPDKSGIHKNLAFVAMKAGDHSQAIESYENATRITPELYSAWVHLGRLHFDAGNFSAALEATEKAEKLGPLEQEFRQMQAKLHAKDYAGTEIAAHSMLKKQPGHPKAIFILAHLASTVGAHEERADILKSGLQFHPAHIDLRGALIAAYENVGNYAAALREAELLVKIRPDSINYLTLSRTYGHIGNHAGSLSSAEKSGGYLAADSEELGTVDLLRGHALKILGRRTESESAYRDSIQHTRNYGAGWWGLADLKTYQFSDDDKQIMESLSGNILAAQDQRCQAAFALAKAFEMDGDHDQAFQWYQRANDLRPDLKYSVDQYGQFCDTSVAEFDTAMLETQANPIPTGPIPIFIIGMPRAGSTLIEQILSSHSQIEGTMELMTLPYVERTVKIDGERKFNKDYPQSLQDFSAAELHAFGQAYLDDTAVFRTSLPFFIDKFPPNFERIGLIHKILPQAIIIDARRHPMDCGFSAYKQHFAGGHEFSYKLENIGNHYNNYLKLMDHWDSVMPGKIKLVQYEEMVRDTEFTTRQILDHIGVGFEESCLRFFENKRAVKTASSEQVRQPIYTNSIGRWQVLSEQLKPLTESLGEETMLRFKPYL